MYALFLLLFACIFAYFLYLHFSHLRIRKLESARLKLNSKQKTPKQKISQQEKIKTTYPVFIPFHEWHGFINGLHYENKNWYLTNGKIGIKPKRWQ